MPYYLTLDILHGLVDVIVLCLIGIILKLACAPPDQPERATTREANRIIFSAYSEHGSEKEAEEIIERLLV